jgi:O-antigen/teichoic acid export membrane protein
MEEVSLQGSDFVSDSSEKPIASQSAAPSKRSLFDFLIVLGGTTFATATGFLLKIMIGRQLGPDSLGIFCICFGMLNSLAVVADLGVRYSTVALASQQLEQSPEKVKSLVGAALMLKLLGGLLAMTLGWFLADWTAHSWFHKENLGPFLRITVSGVFLWSLWDGLEGCLQIKQRFTTAALLRILMDAFRLISYAGLAFYAHGSYLTMDRFMWLYFLAISLSLVVGFPILWNQLRPNLTNFERHATTLIRFSGWIFVYRFLALMLLFLDSLCLSRWNTLHGVGQFEAAKGLAYAMLLISETLGQVLLPKVSQLQNRADLVRFLQRFYRYLGSLCVAAIVWMLVAGKLLFLFGKSFQDPSVLQTFQVLVIASLALMPATVVGTVLIGQHQAKQLGLISIIQVVLALAIYSQTAPIGIVATAACTAGIQCLGAALGVLALRHRVQVLLRHEALEQSSTRGSSN